MEKIYTKHNFGICARAWRQMLRSTKRGRAWGHWKKSSPRIEFGGRVVYRILVIQNTCPANIEVGAVGVAIFWQKATICGDVLNTAESDGLSRRIFNVATLKCHLTGKSGGEGISEIYNVAVSVRIF